MWINPFSVCRPSLIESSICMLLSLKKISKQKLKFGNKPCITLGLQKSISIKNHVLIKYIELKDIALKTEARIK